MARDKVPGSARSLVIRGDDVAAAVLAEAANHDLVIRGLPRQGPRSELLGGVARRIALEAPCATILLSRQR